MSTADALTLAVYFAVAVVAVVAFVAIAERRGWDRKVSEWLERD